MSEHRLDPDTEVRRQSVVVLMRTTNGVPTEVVSQPTELDILKYLQARCVGKRITITDAVSRVRGLKAVHVNDILDGYMIRIS